ncbi:hypothetical protein EI94DRAFT_1700735 [Lactarius quietus]|nr:hypothetical protein EI94DRAFT_1700735 [Lactarius quietus]
MDRFKLGVSRIVVFTLAHPRVNGARLRTPIVDYGTLNTCTNDTEALQVDGWPGVLTNLFGRLMGWGDSLKWTRPMQVWITSPVQENRNVATVVFSPANVIFAGAGVLLSVAIALYLPYRDYSETEPTYAAKNVIASQDALIDIFEGIENFFRRLEEYAEAPPTKAMKAITVKIMVEVLGIFAIVTKELKQGRAKNYWNKLIGRRDIEDALGRPGRLTQEEVRMATAQVLKAAHRVEDGVKTVSEGVKGVDDKVKDVDNKVNQAIEGTYLFRITSAILNPPTARK